MENKIALKQWSITKSTSNQIKTMQQNSNLTNDIREIAKDIQAIYSQAETHYVFAVNSIIQSQNKDEKEIENLLSYMLDFADNERILDSYRKLCRYYFDINPQATAEYIQFYKELYDADEKKFKSGYFKKIR